MLTTKLLSILTEPRVSLSRFAETGIIASYADGAVRVNLGVVNQ